LDFLDFFLLFISRKFDEIIAVHKEKVKALQAMVDSPQRGAKRQLPADEESGSGGKKARGKGAGVNNNTVYLTMAEMLRQGKQSPAKPPKGEGMHDLLQKQLELDERDCEQGSIYFGCST
jgi:hypothetical protein